MTRVVRAMPVLFACRGCERDRVAREAAAALDRRGLAEAAVAGAGAEKARARFPIYALEGCEKRCAARWLASVGVQPQHSYVLEPQEELSVAVCRLESLLSGKGPRAG